MCRLCLAGNVLQLSASGYQILICTPGLYSVPNAVHFSARTLIGVARLSMHSSTSCCLGRILSTFKTDTSSHSQSIELHHLPRLRQYTTTHPRGRIPCAACHSQRWLCRAARVVAWLEFLAGEALDAEEAAVLRGGGTAGRFAPDEGLWKESRIKLASGVAQRPGAIRVTSRN